MTLNFVQFYSDHPLDTGNLFISLLFLRKGTPNYVNIDLKMSPSNLTLGQCKVDLSSMSKTSKLCKVVGENGVTWPLLHKTMILKESSGFFCKFLNGGRTDNHFLFETCKENNIGAI